MLDSTGTEVVKYTYDAWGKPLSTTGSLAATLGAVQPFRYRGYVYDVETGMYYLRSRYYNPNWNRFVNADMYLLTRNNHLYSYCNNNSTNNKDPNGTFGVIAFVIAFIGVEVALHYKMILSSAASAYLEDRGYYVSDVLFQHALWNGPYKFTDKTTDLELLEETNYVKSRIASDPQTKSLIMTHVDNMASGTTKSFPEDPNKTIGFEYTEGDMLYSLQHINYRVGITKHLDGSWEASLHIIDTYNFDSFRFGLETSDLANDLGFILERIGTVSEFQINLEIKVFSD